MDLDGDKDIVTGHLYNSQIDWTGITILENNNAEFTNVDSFYLNGQHRDICIEKFDNNEEWDLTTQCYNGVNSQIGVLFDFYDNQGELLGTYNISAYAGYLDVGDIDGNMATDIAVASNSGQFWGVLYNDGTGEFSYPEYHEVTDYFPSGIACGNLNEDDRNDVVVIGQKTEVYFSYESGFESIILEENNFKEDVAITDMDNDGDNDIVVLVNLYLIGLTVIKIYENNGNNSFFTHEEIVFEPPLSHFEASDLNNDDLPDLVCTGDDGIYILYNEGDFNLSLPPEFFPVANPGEWGGVSYCADLDNNGWNDVITIIHLSSNIPSIVNIFFNDGNGNFVEDPQPTGINDEEFCIQNDKFGIKNYPNPFNPSTTIAFQIPDVESQHVVTLRVYDVSGKLVKTLIDEPMNSGYHSVNWHGKDDNGKQVSSGIYFYRLEVAARGHDPFLRETKRMILLK